MKAIAAILNFGIKFLKCVERNKMRISKYFKFIYFIISDVSNFYIAHFEYGSKDISEPRHDKMCPRGSPTRPDTNRPAQLQRLARFLKFRL